MNIIHILHSFALAVCQRKNSNYRRLCNDLIRIPGFKLSAYNALETPLTTAIDQAAIVSSCLILCASLPPPKYHIVSTHTGVTLGNQKDTGKQKVIDVQSL